MFTGLLLLTMTAGSGEKLEGYQKDWEPQLHSTKFKKKELNAEVKLGKDKIVLRNRGVVVSKKEFAKDGKGVVHVSFTWKWTKGDGAYQDDLAIVFRTNGEQRQEWSHELLNGVLVRLNATAAEVQVVQIQGKTHDLIGKTGVMFKKNTEYNVRITDDGQRIEVFIDDAKEPVFAKNAPPLNSDSGRKIAFYDREAVGGQEHEGIITNLKIEVKK